MPAWLQLNKLTCTGSADSRDSTLAAGPDSFAARTGSSLSGKLLFSASVWQAAVNLGLILLLIRHSTFAFGCFCKARESTQRWSVSDWACL